MADAYTEPEGTESADASGAGSARPWLAMIKEGEQYFQAYQDKADNIDKLYSDLEAMANTARDREMQVFWANLEVVKPSIYARPPVPVAVPRFKDRKELPRKAAEMVERALSSSFDAEDIDATMRLIRDDLAVNARGVVWLRYDTEGEDGATESVCYDHLERKDFLHGPARKWREVPWVARRSYLTRKQGLARFKDVFLQAEFKDYAEDTDEKDPYKGEQKACVWEIWHREKKTVVWVSPGVDDLLDEQPPILNLHGFFPCPRPAYGTLQRRTLKPVPDFVYYKDQIEEINELTARISSLAESLRLRGFYAQGSGDVADAIEAALRARDNNAILVGISNYAAIGGQALKDSIAWLPVRDVAEVITQLVALRKQLIDDVYQITGLSDIMRGSTEASETATAQKLKSQYGSIRVRDRQAELVRIARDMARMAAEIMAENFEPQTLIRMSQMNDLPTEAQIKQQIQQMIGQAKQLAANPQVQQQAQQNPQQAKQIIQQMRDQIGQLEQSVTVEKVVALLRSESVRPFVLDIETDSTIQPDEDAQKQRATEFITAVGGFMGQLLPLAASMPQVSQLGGEMLKYVASQFRAGRELEGVIDQFSDQMSQAAQQPKPPDPQAQAIEAKMKQAEQAHQLDQQSKQQDAQLKQQDAQHAAAMREQETAAKVQATHASMTQAAEKHAQDMQKGALEIEALKAKTAAALVPPAEAPPKPPATSIPFEGLPPEGKVQVAAQAGIKITPQMVQAHDAAQAAQLVAQKAAAKPPASAGSPAKG